MANALKQKRGNTNPIQSRIIENNHGTGSDSGSPSSTSCENIVLSLSEDIQTPIPHNFQNNVCNYKAYDSLGNDIELSFNLNPITLQLNACSTTNLTNILIIVQGE